MKNKGHTKSVKRMICIVMVIALCTEVIIPAKAKAAERSDFTEYHFSLIEKKQLGDGNNVYYLEHSSGAKIVYTDNKEEDKLFSIGFCTPNVENNAASHVLEHVILSGSELYPSRDIFNYMTTTSVATEINGYTQKDYTVYPFSTRNKKDYENLLSVYLSSVFRPMFLKDEKIFKRDGIRKEYRDGKVYYNGIVYSENKGKSNGAGTAEEQIGSQLLTELYKGTNLHYGGISIEGLKTLTYQDVVDTYQKYYTTSNCLVYLSGNVDLKYTLQQLDEYFTTYGKKGEKITVQAVPSPADKNFETNFSSSETDETYSAGILTSGAKIIEPKERKTFELIWNYIGKKLAEPYSNCSVLVDDGFYFTMGLIFPKGNKEKAEQFLNDYKNIVTDIEKNGIAKKDAEDGIAILNNNIYTYATERVYKAMEGFTYGNNPLLLLDQVNADKIIKNEVPSYFSDFMKNTFKKSQIMVLSQGKTEAIQEVSDEVTGKVNVEQIKKETEEYNKWIETEEPQSVLSKNPVLERKDFEAVDHDFSAMKETGNGIIYTYSNLKNPDTFTFTYSFELSSLGTEKEIREAQLLCNLFNLSLQEQGISNISCILQAYKNRVDTESYKPVFEIWGNGTKEQLNKVLELVQKQFLDNTAIFDKKSFNKKFDTIKKTVNATVQDYGLERLAQINAMLSNAGKYQTIATGLAGEGSSSYSAWLNEQKKTQSSSLIKELKQIKSKVFNKNNLCVSFRGSSALFTAFKKESKGLLSSLENKKYKKVSVKLPKVPYESVAYVVNDKNNTGNFVQIGSLVSKKTPVNGSMMVLANYLTSAYIKPRMRSIGAYGGQFDVTENGAFKITVSRVSDVKGALKQLNGTGNFLKNTKFTQKELDANIIKTVNSLDNTYLYSETSGSDFYLHGFTKEAYLKLRKEILSTTVKDIKAYASVLDKAIAKNYINAVGNKTFIDSFGMDFKNVKKVD